MEATQQSRIGLVGASARAAAFSAVRARYVPLTADLFADADLMRCAEVVRVEKYPHGLLEWLRTTPEETPWIYTGALENYPDLVDEMAAVRPLVGCSGDVLRRIRNPLELAKLLTKVDVPFPATITYPPRLPLGGGGAGGGGETMAADAARGGWLLKTHRGSSGSGIRVWDGLPPKSSPTPLVLQRQIEGTPGSAVFVGGGGEATFLGSTRQLVGTPWTYATRFQYAGSIGPWRLESSAEADLQRAGIAIAQAGVAGLFGVDFVLCVADGRPYVVEVNPRYTASVEVVEKMAGLSAFGMHMAAASSGGPAPPAPPPSREREEKKVLAPAGTREAIGCGKAILFAPRDIRVTQAFIDWTRTTATGPPWPKLADLPHAGTFIPSGRPVLTIFAGGTSLAEVERRLQERMEDVERQLLIDQ